MIGPQTGRQARALLGGSVASYDPQEFDAAVEARHGTDTMLAVQAVRERSDALDYAAEVCRTLWE